MDWTKIAECTIIIVTWWQDCNTTTWIQSNQFETQIWSFFCNTWLIYMKEKKTEYHRTITVVILLKEKEKRHFKKCYRQKRMIWEWCACIRKKCHFLNYSLMCVWIFDAWNEENKYNFYITYICGSSSLDLYRWTL